VACDHEAISLAPFLQGSSMRHFAAVSAARRPTAYIVGGSAFPLERAPSMSLFRAMSHCSKSSYAAAKCRDSFLCFREAQRASPC
jgi:hypothetical protein